MADLGTIDNPYDFRKTQHRMLAIANGHYLKGDSAVSEVQKRLVAQDNKFRGLSDFWQSVVKKEGFVDGYYYDIRGVLTRGVGQTQEFLKGPTSLSGFPAAMNKVNAAVDEQYNELSSHYEVTSQLKDALYSVNFQLGTKWNNKFKGVWSGLMNKDFDSAINNVKYSDPKNIDKGTSPWFQQTQDRAEDFMDAIKHQKDYIGIDSHNKDMHASVNHFDDVRKDIMKSL